MVTYESLYIKLKLHIVLIQSLRLYRYAGVGVFMYIRCTEVKMN